MKRLFGVSKTAEIKTIDYVFINLELKFVAIVSLNLWTVRTFKFMKDLNISIDINENIEIHTPKPGIFQVNFTDAIDGLRFLECEVGNEIIERLRTKWTKRPKTAKQAIKSFDIFPYIYKIHITDTKNHSHVYTVKNFVFILNRDCYFSLDQKNLSFI